VSHESLKKDIEFILSEIDRELEATSPLLALAEAKKLDAIHTIAAAAVLHSVYGAIESIFALIQKRFDGRSLETGQWHRALLDTMTKATEHRPAVLSVGCRDTLEDYLAFRHRFRHGYGWQLDPVKVAIKLSQLPQVLYQTQNEVRLFLQALDQQHPQDQ